MITPAHLRRALRSYLYVEHNEDEYFAQDLARGKGVFDDELRLGLARTLATGEMDFDDFANVTDNQGMEDDEVIARLRRIWDSAFPGVTPEQALVDPSVLPRSE